MVYHRSSKAGADSGAASDDDDDARAKAKAKAAQNVFRNDGSFLEMFKRMQEATSSASSTSTSSSSSSSSAATAPLKSAEQKCTSPKSEGKKQPVGSAQSSSSAPKLPMVGKRRGGRVLPTGQVKKAKVEKREVEEAKPKDAWSQYLAEVKRYRETTCEEEGKTRPLVK